MANENKKNTELVAEDDDPTSELEALTLQRVPDSVDDQGVPELDASTFNFERPSAQTETIERLQFDIEQLRARWTGLETEIKAREELTSKLHSELNTKTHALSRKDKLISKRDRAVKALKAEIRERNKELTKLRESVEELQTHNEQLQASDEISKAKQQIDAQAGHLAGIQAAFKEAKEQQGRTESYADKLRRQLNDLSGNLESAGGERETLRLSLEEAQDDTRALTTKLAAANVQTELLDDELDKMESAHAEEIRILRFELGEAEQTLSETEHVSEQLASDLVDNRSYRDGLERLLEEERETSGETLEKLQNKVKKLESTIVDYEQKLETKSDAVNCLLAELAKKSQEIESISDIEEVIHEIDDRMSERIDERPAPERDRITRLLIGRVDDQELRFPLFKDRLTIGRTQQNDIQLKAQYISRRHAVITTEGDAARVVDWGSKNGVYVNSKRVSEHFLKNGDIVTIGIAEFRFEELPKRDM